MMSDRCVRCMMDEHELCDGNRYGPHHQEGPYVLKQQPCICKSKSHQQTTEENVA